MDKKTIQLSNGETRKVMLARALLIRPRLLILDNPLTGLDQDYRKHLKAILGNLMKDDMRFIIVTSRQDEILPGITHVLMIEDQKIISTGPKKEVLEIISARKIWECSSSIAYNLMAPQTPELHLHFPSEITSFNAVCSGFFDSVGLYRRCSPEQRRTAGLWMENLGLLKYDGTMFHNLSDGTQRLILIARAMVKQPVLLVMDEPCQGLDAGNRHRVLRLVDAIGNQMDVTVIFVSHDPEHIPGSITHKLTLN